MDCTLPQLAERTNLSIQQVRTALDKLKLTGEITVRKIAKTSIISIVNYNKYQDNQHDNQQENNRKITGKQQEDNSLYKKERKKEIKNVINTRSRVNEKIHNFPEREYNFEELSKQIRKKGD